MQKIRLRFTEVGENYNAFDLKQGKQASEEVLLGVNCKKESVSFELSEKTTKEKTLGTTSLNVNDTEQGMLRG